MKKFTRRLSMATIVTLLSAISIVLLCPLWRPSFVISSLLLAGVAGSCVSIMWKMPMLEVSPSGEPIEGTLKTFSSIGGSGNPILRHFCPECGSSIAEEPGTRTGMIILNVGTFDDPTVAKAGREIFRDDALPWVEVHGEIPRFAKRPG
jgi:hypothetical protein